MADHDFTLLYDKYPGIIAQMPHEFTSHQFILRLARQEQKLYIEALYDYRDSLHKGEEAPFMKVHGILSQRLLDLPNLVARVGQVSSTDIFGQSNNCALWRRVEK